MFGIIATSKSGTDIWIKGLQKGGTQFTISADKPKQFASEAEALEAIRILKQALVKRRQPVPTFSIEEI